MRISLGTLIILSGYGDRRVWLAYHLARACVTAGREPHITWRRDASGDDDFRVRIGGAKAVDASA